LLQLHVVDLHQSGADDGQRSTASVDQPSTANCAEQRRTTTDDVQATDEFDVYTIETALPHVEWDRLEESLRLSAGEQNKRWVSSLIHRGELYMLNTLRNDTESTNKMQYQYQPVNNSSNKALIIIISIFYMASVYVWHWNANMCSGVFKPPESLHEGEDHRTLIRRQSGPLEDSGRSVDMA